MSKVAVGLLVVVFLQGVVISYLYGKNTAFGDTEEIYLDIACEHEGEFRSAIARHMPGGVMGKSLPEVTEAMLGRCESN